MQEPLAAGPALSLRTWGMRMHLSTSVTGGDRYVLLCNRWPVHDASEVLHHYHNDNDLRGCKA